MAVVKRAKWRHRLLLWSSLGIFLAILSETQKWASAEVFSSASDMKEVFRLERELVSIMDGFASKLQTKLNKINSYLEVRKIRSEHLLRRRIIFGHYLYWKQQIELARLRFYKFKGSFELNVIHVFLRASCFSAFLALLGLAFVVF